MARGMRTPSTRLEHAHEHLSLKLWVSNWVSPSDLRCPKELDVKGSPSRALWSLVLPSTPFRVAQSPVCGSDSYVRASREGS